MDKTTKSNLLYARYWRKLSIAKTLHQAKVIYRKFAKAFTDDKITFAQYSKLRKVYHDRAWEIIEAQD